MENLDIKTSPKPAQKNIQHPYVDWAAKSSGISTNRSIRRDHTRHRLHPGKRLIVDFMALHQILYSKFIRNTHVRELVHAGGASLGPNGGAFTFPGYPTVKVVTDFA